MERLYQTGGIMKTKFLLHLLIVLVITRLCFAFPNESEGISARKEAEPNVVYTVPECLNILKNHPEEFKGKDILLKAIFVDAGQGLGCENYFVLTAGEFADLYKKRYNLNLTAQEKEKIDQIPEIFAKFASPLPPAKAGEPILKGHFFDNSVKNCEEGWKWFVITGTK